MAGEVRFLIDNIFSGASLSASSAAAGLPVSHLTDERIRKVYQSIGKANEWVVLEPSGANASLSAISICGFNLTKNATVHFQGNDTNVWTSPTLDEVLTVPTDGLGRVVPKITKLFTEVDLNFYRVYVEDSTNAATSIQLGVIQGGVPITPERAPRDGFRRELKDPSVGRMTAGRQGYWKVRSKYEEISYSVFDMTEAETDEVYAIFEQVGFHTPFIFMLEPDNRPSHSTFYCNFVQNVSTTHRILRNYNLDSLRMREIV